MKYHVLTANLPASLRLNLKHRLTGAGGSLTVAKNIADAVRLCAGQLCHLIVLVFTDLNACEEILTALRHVSFAPIVILADEYDSDQAGVVLDAGADLCLPVKSPIGFLSGHVMAQLRRYTAYNNFESPQERENVPIQSGDIYIDPMRRVVKVKGKDVSLRPREFSLLWYFVRNPDVVLTTEQICEHAWGMEGGYNQGVSQPIRLLRQAIEPAPDHPIYIKTIWRVGYRYTAHYGETCDEC